MTYMGHFFWVSPGQSSCSAWLSVHIWYNSASSPVRVHLLAKMDSSTETLESLTPPIMGWHPSLFSPQGTFLCMNSWKDLFDLKNEKYVVSLSFIWAGSSSSLPLPLSYLGVSAHGRETPAQPGASMETTDTGIFHVIKYPHHFMF